MLKKNLFNTISEIKTPERKLNVLMPVMAVFTLAGFSYFLFSILNSTRKQDIIDCKIEKDELRKENVVLKHERDSIVYLWYNEKNETIKQLETIIKKQNEQKKLMRKK